MRSLRSSATSSRRSRPKRGCCRLAEVSALFHSAGSVHLRGRGEVALHLDLSGPAAARRAFSLLRELGIRSEIRTYRRQAFDRATRYQLHVAGDESALATLVEAGVLDSRHAPLERPPRRVVGRACCRGAYLRGALLGGGLALRAALAASRAAHRIARGGRVPPLGRRRRRSQGRSARPREARGRLREGDGGDRGAARCGRRRRRGARARGARCRSPRRGPRRTGWRTPTTRTSSARAAPHRRQLEAVRALRRRGALDAAARAAARGRAPSASPPEPLPARAGGEVRPPDDEGVGPPPAEQARRARGRSPAQLKLGESSRGALSPRRPRPEAKGAGRRGWSEDDLPLRSTALRTGDRRGLNPPPDEHGPAGSKTYEKAVRFDTGVTSRKPSVARAPARDVTVVLACMRPTRI